MAVQGKKRIVVYLDEENVKILRNYLDTRPGAGGLSEILDKHVTRLADVIRKNEKKLAKIEPGRLTIKKFFKLAGLDV
jgi:arsenate reductase-like glutaredoxin family protein